MRTDTSFVEITVGDPEVADVKPLTDHSLSILGKKIGTTRVSVYGEGKKLIGMFDVEVSYDTSLLADRDPAPLPARAASGSRRSTAASCCRAPRPTRPTLDKAVVIAQASSARTSSTRCRCCSRSRSCWRCASSRPSAGRPRARRAVERVRPAHIVANIGNRTHGGQLPVTNTGSAASAAGRHRRAADQHRPVGISPSPWPACCPAARRSASCSAA